MEVLGALFHVGQARHTLGQQHDVSVKLCIAEGLDGVYGPGDEPGQGVVKGKPVFLCVFVYPRDVKVEGHAVKRIRCVGEELKQLAAGPLTVIYYLIIICTHFALLLVSYMKIP